MSITKPNNLAARMGRWSADHWKTATFGWLGFVLVAFALGGAIGTKFIDPNAPGPAYYVGGQAKLIIPIAIYLGICAIAVWVFRREAPVIAEAL
jgi:hypothetical protein